MATASDFETSLKAANAVSGALKEYDEIFNKAADVLDDVGEVTNKLGKVAKLAKGLGAACVVFDIGLSLFGPESAEMQKLNQIVSLVENLQKRVETLSGDMEDGFRRVINKATYLQGLSQIFTPISQINVFTKSVRTYLKSKTKADIAHAEDLLLEHSINDLRRAMESIERACSGSIATNLLEAATIDSNADLKVIKELGANLLSTVTCGSMCANYYWSIKHKGNLAEQKAAKRTVQEDYDSWIDKITESIDKAIKHCVKSSTVLSNVEEGVKEAASKLANNIDAGVATEQVFKELSAKWPLVDIMTIVAKTNHILKWDSYSLHGFPATTIQEPAANNKLLVVVLVKSRENANGTKTSWKHLPVLQQSNIRNFLDYHWAQKFHELNYNDPTTSFRPYSFLEIGGYSRGLIYTKGKFQNEYFQHKGNTYDLIVPA